MCDTVIVTPQASLDGVVIFGKNSDREPNEAHLLEQHSAQDHPAGSRVRMTYIEIPQAEHTFAVLLAKPFNIWGAEMGANEHGVVIGNEAVFTRVPYEKGPAMTGMDLLRLGLERAAGAAEAVKTMTALLEAHGQGGNCGFQHPFYYHNSYIIADPREAWVLETAGRHWAAKRVQGVYTISNAITIGSEWDLASADLASHAVERGWCKSRADFDFARCYSDTLYTSFGASRYRCGRTTALLQRERGRITPRMVMDVLRDHGDSSGDWRPDRGLAGAQVCMHVGFGPVRINQTTGSMVSHLHSEHPTHFFTGTAAPCTSLFKPVWLDAGLPDTGPVPQGVYDPHSLFWRHECLHRQTLQDYARRMAAYAGERAALEEQLVSQALELAAAPAGRRYTFSAQSLAQAAHVESEWMGRIRSLPIQRASGKLYQLAWKGFNRQANLPECEEEMYDQTVGRTDRGFAG